MWVLGQQRQTLGGRLYNGHGKRIIQAGVDVQDCGGKDVREVCRPKESLLNDGIRHSQLEPPLEAFSILPCIALPLTAAVAVQSALALQFSSLCTQGERCASHAPCTRGLLSLGHRMCMKADRCQSTRHCAHARLSGGSSVRSRPGRAQHTCRGCAEQGGQAEAGQRAAPLQLLRQLHKAAAPSPATAACSRAAASWPARTLHSDSPALPPPAAGLEASSALTLVLAPGES